MLHSVLQTTTAVFKYLVTSKTRTTMGMRSRLTEEKKAKIDVLHDQIYSDQTIGETIGRSKSAVNGYLAKKKDNAKPKRIGRPKLRSERAQRALINIANKGRMPARKIMNRAPVQVSLRTVQGILSEHRDLKFGYLKVRPRLTKDQIIDRYKWCKMKSKMTMEDWHKVLFMDEKRFCLDGPDGQAKFWADRRLSPEIFSKRARGAGGVMVWAGISWEGKTKFAFVNGTLNAVAYTDMLDGYFFPFAEEYHPGGCVLQ